MKKKRKKVHHQADVQQLLNCNKHLLKFFHKFCSIAPLLQLQCRNKFGLFAYKSESNKIAHTILKFFFLSVIL